MGHRVLVAVILGVAFVSTACGPDPSGISRRKLRQPETIEGVPCTSYTTFYPDGRLSSCFLAEDSEVAGHLLPKGTRVEFDEMGRLDHCFLGRETEIEGHLCRGHGHEYMTAFHPSGRLRTCWLARAEEIDGVPCRRATMIADIVGGSVGATFYESGRLRGCEADRDFTREGRNFSRGDRVELDEEGALLAATP